MLTINRWIMLGFRNVEKCHCMKSVRIRSFSSLYFPAFELRISPYSVQMWENTNRKISEYGHFSRSVCAWDYAKVNLKYGNEWNPWLVWVKQSLSKKTLTVEMKIQGQSITMMTCLLPETFFLVPGQIWSEEKCIVLIDAYLEPSPILPMFVSQLKVSFI